MYDEKVSMGNNPMTVKKLSELENIISNFKVELSKLSENNYELLNKVDKMVGCELQDDCAEKSSPTDENIVDVLNECIRELGYKNNNFREQLSRLGGIVG